NREHGKWHFTSRPQTKPGQHGGTSRPSRQSAPSSPHPFVQYTASGAHTLLPGVDEATQHVPGQPSEQSSTPASVSEAPLSSSIG
ncbi:MAG TPA: hypothetical protein VGM29_12250, partial [Polyangiaceae bacterium]